MVKKAYRTIKVVTQIERSGIPGIVDLVIIVDRTSQPDFQDRQLQSLVADFQRIGNQEVSYREVQSSPAEEMPVCWMIEVKSIPFDSRRAVLGLLQNHLKGVGGGVRFAISSPELEAMNLKQLQQENETRAAEIASTLLVRILSLESEDLISFLGKGETYGYAELSDLLNLSVELPIHSKLTRTYRTSRFPSLKYNAKLLLENFDLDLIRRQLRYFRFKRGFSGYRPAVGCPMEMSESKLDGPKAVIFGHFSFPGGGGTFGDLEAMEMVRDWLDDLGIAYDVVSNQEDGAEGIAISEVRAEDYGILIFVCGPWYSAGKIHAGLLDRFQHCYKIGVNLTTFEEGRAGFDRLLSRDNLVEKNVDIAFGKQVPQVPVAGILLIERQKAYGFQQRHQYIKKVVFRYLEENTLAPIWLDTNASLNRMGIHTYQQFESIFKRTDFVITDRLHGVVLSLKNSIPVIAIDPVEGGGKVTAQVEALDWPLLIKAEEFSIENLHQAVTDLQSKDFSSELSRSWAQAEGSLQQTRRDFDRAVEEAQLEDPGTGNLNQRPGKKNV